MCPIWRVPYRPPSKLPPPVMPKQITWQGRRCFEEQRDDPFIAVEGHPKAVNNQTPRYSGIDKTPTLTWYAAEAAPQGKGGFKVDMLRWRVCVEGSESAHTLTRVYKAAVSHHFSRRS